ncbi:hypothetical protein CTI14_72510, partial [Methylobacterium radiotolerans]
HDARHPQRADGTDRASDAFGGSATQKLLKVQLPSHDARHPQRADGTDRASDAFGGSATQKLLKVQLP